MTERIERKPVKIGARVLSEEEASVLLPGYRLILDQIKRFRQEAANISETRVLHNSDTNREFERHYDNTISILGCRGAGKTSVLLTLKHYYETKNNCDIVLPLVVPEFISSQNDTMSWIIYYLGNEIEKIAEKIQQYSYQHVKPFCNRTDFSLIQKNFREVQNGYILRSPRFRDFIQNLEEGVGDYFEDIERIIRADQILYDEFSELINHLIDAKRELNKVMGVNKYIEPMILIFFDDVDISAERCGEVLDAIRMFLAHPNVVQIVSGDINVFSEALTIEFLHKEKIQGDQLSKIFVPEEPLKLASNIAKTALEIRKSRSQEYIKKMFPPSFRHFMKAFSEQEKRDFSYDFRIENRKESAKTLSLGELIEQIKVEEIDKTDLAILHRQYFKIFDDNPRALMSPYYFLFNKIEFVNQDEWRSNYFIINELNQFLQVIINSSNDLRQFREEIAKIIVIDLSNSDSTLTRVDYHYIDDLFLKAKDKLKKPRNNYNDSLEMISQHNKEILVNSFIPLMLLANLFERIISPSKDNNYPKFTNRLVNLLNMANSRFMLYPKTLNINFILSLYEDLEHFTSFEMRENMFVLLSNNTVRPYDGLYLESRYYKGLANLFEEYCLDQQTEKTEEARIARLLACMFNEDKEWAENHVKFIYNAVPDIPEIFKLVINNMVNELSFLRINLPDYDTWEKSLAEWKSKEEGIIGCLKQKIENVGDVNFKSINEINLYKINLDAKAKIYLGKRRFGELETEIRILEKEIESLQNEITGIEEALGDISPEAQEHTMVKRLKMLRRLSELNEFITQGEEEWQRLSRKITDDSSQSEPMEAIVEINLKQVLERFFTEEELSEIKVIPTVKRVYPKVTEELDLFTRNLIRSYVEAKEEKKLIEQYMPFDIVARKQHLELLKKRYSDRENEHKRLLYELSSINIELVNNNLTGLQMNEEDLLQNYNNWYEMKFEFQKNEILKVQRNNSNPSYPLDQWRKISDLIISFIEDLSIPKLDVNIEPVIVDAVTMVENYIRPLRNVSFVSSLKAIKQAEGTVMDYFLYREYVEAIKNYCRVSIDNSPPHVRKRILEAVSMLEKPLEEGLIIANRSTSNKIRNIDDLEKKALKEFVDQRLIGDYLDIRILMEALKIGENENVVFLQNVRYHLQKCLKKEKTYTIGNGFTVLLKHVFRE